MPGALILINGFPGIGKHAVAYELVKLLPNCKFFDTRSLVSAATQLYESDDPAHGHLRKNLKHAIFDSIARQFAVASPTGPPPPTYVLTDFLSVAARPTDLAIMHEFIAFAQRSGFAFIHVILSATQDVNVERLTSPQRQDAKAKGALTISTDPGQLIQTRMEEEIGHIAPVAGLCGEYELDTTRMDARTTAGVLAEYCLDTLRNEGWWLQLNNANAGRKTAQVAVGGGGRRK